MADFVSQLSCVQVEVLLAAYSGNRTAKQRHTAPSYLDAVAFMKRWEMTDQHGEITERGRAWVESILATPMPVRSWKDPRF